MKKDTSIFRKASLSQIQSPEDLNSYIQVTNVNVWIVLSGVILLLIGVIIWGIFGNITTTVTVPVVVSDGQATFYVNPQDADRIETGMTVTADGQQAAITTFSKKPMEIGEDMNSYAAFIGGFSQGDFCYSGHVTLPLADGVYEGVLTIESLHPMQFVLH